MNMRLAILYVSFLFLFSIAFKVNATQADFEFLDQTNIGKAGYSYQVNIPILYADQAAYEWNWDTTAIVDFEQYSIPVITIPSADREYPITLNVTRKSDKAVSYITRIVKVNNLGQITGNRVDSQKPFESDGSSDNSISVSIKGDSSATVDVKTGNFTASPTGFDSYKWSVSPNANIAYPSDSSTTITFNSNGIYTVRLDVTKGSDSTFATRTVTVTKQTITFDIRASINTATALALAKKPNPSGLDVSLPVIQSGTRVNFVPDIIDDNYSYTWNVYDANKPNQSLLEAGQENTKREFSHDFNATESDITYGVSLEISADSIQTTPVSRYLKVKPTTEPRIELLKEQEDIDIGCNERSYVFEPLLVDNNDAVTSITWKEFDETTEIKATVEEVRNDNNTKRYNFSKKEGIEISEKYEVKISAIISTNLYPNGVDKEYSFTITNDDLMKACPKAQFKLTKSTEPTCRNVVYDLDVSYSENGTPKPSEDAGELNYDWTVYKIKDDSKTKVTKPIEQNKLTLDEVGTYEVELVVSDNTGSSEPYTPTDTANHPIEIEKTDLESDAGCPVEVSFSYATKYFRLEQEQNKDKCCAVEEFNRQVLFKIDSFVENNVENYQWSVNGKSEAFTHLGGGYYVYTFPKTADNFIQHYEVTLKDTSSEDITHTEYVYLDKLVDETIPRFTVTKQDDSEGNVSWLFDTSSTIFLGDDEFSSIEITKPITGGQQDVGATRQETTATATLSQEQLESLNIINVQVKTNKSNHDDAPAQLPIITDEQGNFSFDLKPYAHITLLSKISDGTVPYSVYLDASKSFATEKGAEIIGYQWKAITVPDGETQASCDDAVNSNVIGSFNTVQTRLTFLQPAATYYRVCLTVTTSNGKSNTTGTGNIVVNDITTNGSIMDILPAPQAESSEGLQLSISKGVLRDNSEATAIKENGNIQYYDIASQEHTDLFFRLTNLPQAEDNSNGDVYVILNYETSVTELDVLNGFYYKTNGHYNTLLLNKDLSDFKQEDVYTFIVDNAQPFKTLTQTNETLLVETGEFFGYPGTYTYIVGYKPTGDNKPIYYTSSTLKVRDSSLYFVD